MLPEIFLVALPAVVVVEEGIHVLELVGSFGRRLSCLVVAEPLVGVVPILLPFHQLAENASHVLVKVFCQFGLLISSEHLFGHHNIRPMPSRTPIVRPSKPFPRSLWPLWAILLVLKSRHVERSWLPDASRRVSQVLYRTAIHKKEIMRRRILGAQDPEVSELGPGCMGMSEFYGTGEGESVATIHRAMELGVTLPDTADMYGPFTNERLAGEANRGRRDEVVPATRLGNVSGENGERLGVSREPDYSRRACAASLRRLGVEHIALYLQHRVDPATPVEERRRGERWPGS